MHTLRITSLRAVSIACTLALSAATAFAQSIFTWDANGTTATQTNGSGQWLGSGQWWDGAANVNWDNLNPVIAQFGIAGVPGATADTVTITGQAVNVAGMNFLGLSASATALPYTIAAASGGSIAFADNAVINVAEGSSTGSFFITFSAPITGNNLTIQKSAGTNYGYVTFSGATTLTGTLTIKNSFGGLWVRSTNAANFAGVSSIVVENGSAFAMSGGGTFGQAFSLAGFGGGTGTYGAIRLDSSNTTISGPITLTADAGILSNGLITGTVVSGSIGGNYGFSRYAIFSGGVGTFAFTGTNTYTGTTTLGRTASTYNGAITSIDFSATTAPTEDILYHGVTNAGTLSLQAGYNSATVLNVVGKAGTINSQRFGDVIVNAGFAGQGGLTAINLTSGAGGSMNVSIGAITRTGASMLAIGGPAAGVINTTMADGILGPWATYRDASGKTSWAQVSGGVITGGFAGNLTHVTGSTVSTLPGYSSDSHLTISGSSSGNVTVASGTTDLRTVSMTDKCDDRVLDLTGGTLRLGATASGGGGIQLGADAGNLLITGGTLTSGGPTADTAGQIIVTNTSVKSLIQIDSAITNNGSGAVMLLFNGVTGSKVVLAGNNTFTGGTTIASGAVEMRSGNALGTSGTVTVMQNAELQLSGSITANRSFTITGNGQNNTGAIRNLGGNNTINGTVTITANTLIMSDAGTLNFTSGTNSFTPTTTGYNLTFGGAGDTVVNGRINFTTQGVVKNGTGMLTVGGNNTAITTGAFTVNEGVLRITHVNALGNATQGVTTVNSGSSLELFFSTDSTVAESIVFNGTGFNNTGAIRNVSGNNTLSGALTTTNASATAANSITADAGTTLTISGSVKNGSSSGSSTRLVHLGGAGTINVTGVITNGGVATAVTTLTKNDSGTVNLTGTNTYTGLTTVNNGTLHLNFDGAGAPASNILYNGVTLSSSVGTLVMAGATFKTTGKTNSVSSQAMGTLTLNAGYSRITAVSTGTGAMNLSFGDITRAAGATLRFDPPSSGSLKTTAGADNALLAVGGVAFSTMGADDWAATGVAVSGSRSIVGLSTIANGYTASTATTLAGNADVAAGVTATALSGNTTLSSLRFHQAQATTVTVGSGNDLTTGGILVSSNVGANDAAIRGGNLRAATATSDLVIIQNNTAGSLTLSGHLYAPITKAGAGTLILEYNTAYVAGDYTGDFRIQEGVMQLVKTTATSISYGTYYSANYILGSGGSSAKLVLGGTGGNAVALWGGLRTQGSGTSNALVGGTASLATFRHYVSTTSDFRSGFIGGSGTFENNVSVIIDQGTLQLGSSNTYKGSTIVNRNILEVTKLADRGQASSLGTGDFDASSHIIQMAGLTTSALNASALATLRYIGDTDSVTNRPIIVTNTDTADSVVSVVAAIENVGKGTLKFTSAFTAGGSNTVQRVLRLGGTNTGENEIVSYADASASISSKLEKVGTGRWVLTGNSTYTGGTTISEGILQLGKGGTSGMVGMGDVAISTGATLATNRSDTFSIYNNITGAGSVVVNNAPTGVLVLDSVGNTYTGGTKVNTGTLMVNNAYGASGTGTGSVSVEASGTLAGTGSIASSAGNSVVVRGLLSVGEHYTGAADLHITTSGSGSLTVEACGVIALDLVSGAGSGMLNAPEEADMLVIGGNVLLNEGSILRVLNLNGLVDWAIGDAWQIIDWNTLGTTRTGAFTALDLPTLTEAYKWDTSALYTSGIITVADAVPEPGRAMLLGIAFAGLVLRRRRKLL
ncbi:autotransporter-associated beta strand repeat-containing protein [Roseimicrobium sp. ORNL1]|uniref:beta strand repeat-containing protein n=1 Tax=Roseimicrobium sp. ORNL1 TaxID=2711231 RepID=UPI0013E0EE1B|nr:autotransporter-associated beta strand repeat-containing protein [Roseimicrobium sp. ORNL1]QIF04357.1 PEP-CTERM sorting domain-containing protein [Roseimicrobium sp. ORNL1]